MDTVFGIDLPVFSFVKIAFLFGLLLYTIIGLVVVKQTNLMTDTLELGHEKIIRALAKVHLILIIVVFFFALIFL